MKKGNEYELTIVDTEFPGYGIAKLEGTDVYVKNVVPGQKILGRITKKRREYAEARALEILEDAGCKCDKSCPNAASCGGCTYMGISYLRQLELKKQQILKLFKKARIDQFEFLGIEGSPGEFEYRNKMEFTFGDFEKGGELTLGMHMKGSTYAIVSAENCEIVDSDYRLILNTVQKYFRAKKLPHYRVMSHEGYLRNLVIRKAQNTQEIMINIVTTSELDFDFKELTEILVGLKYSGKLTGILHTTNDSLSDVVVLGSMEILFGRDYIYEELLGLRFKISPFSFFQTNSRGAEKLYSIVKNFLGNPEDKVIFDLYCGTGTIGQIVSRGAKKVIGIELIEEAVKAANENASMNGLNNCEFIAGDVSKVINEINENPDVIILDPPRPGVHPTALKYVMDFNPEEIIYVSCNPKTLVTDLKVILSNGYKIDKMILMDMFPHTPHVECVVKIERNIMAHLE